MIEQEIKLHEEPIRAIVTYTHYNDYDKNFDLKDLLKNAQDALKINEIYKYKNGDTYVIIKGFVTQESELAKFNKKAVILAERVSKYAIPGQITHYSLGEFLSGYMEKVDVIPNIYETNPRPYFLEHELNYDY